MPREYPRKLRVANELRRVLNDILRDDIKDPRLQQVSVSQVELSGDIGVAKVFFSTLVPDSDLDPIIVALEKARGYLRSGAGELLFLRHIPELRFYEDKATKHGFKLTQLLDKTKKTSNQLIDDDSHSVSSIDNDIL